MRKLAVGFVLLAQMNCCVLVGPSFAMSSSDVEKVHKLLGDKEAVEKNIELLGAMKPGKDKSLGIAVTDCPAYAYYIYSGGTPDKCHGINAEIDADDVKDIVKMMEKREARIEKSIKGYGVEP